MSTATTKPKRQQKFVVSRADEIEDGGRLVVEVNGREVGIFNVKGTFYAILNRCPHLGGPLVKGMMVNEITSTGQGNIEVNRDHNLIACPWHNWEFDIKTGQSYWNPANLKARPFAVDVQTGADVAAQVDSGAVGRIEGPYRAEMIDVSVEHDYVVLSMRPIVPGAAVIADGAVTETTARGAAGSTIRSGCAIQLRDLPEDAPPTNRPQTPAPSRSNTEEVAP